MRPSSCLTTLLFVFAAFANAGIANAAPPNEADALHTEGVAAFKRQDYESARAAFARSYELAPRTSTLLNLALAELNAGHPVDALKHFRAFVLAPDAPPSKADDVKARMIPRAEAQIGRIQIDAPSNLPVTVDGMGVGTSPLVEIIEVMPGEHEIAVGATGARRGVLRVSVIAGDIARVHIDLPPAAAPSSQPAPTSPVRISTASDHPAADGKWPTAKKVVFVALGATALVSVVTGIAFNVAANDDANHATELRTQIPMGGCFTGSGQAPHPLCGDLASTIDAYHSHRDLSIGLYVTGGVAAAGALATWFVWPNAKASGRAMIAPAVGRINGIQISGTW